MMKLGYPCINRGIDCRGNSTFRLRSYTEQRLLATVGRNLECLQRILQYNVEHELCFFRITSDLVPFASHEICKSDWETSFQPQFQCLGSYIRRHDLRISMHPDQFTLLNSPREDVTLRSIAELQYHADVLDAMQLPLTARIQLHVGGVYKDKKTAMARFVERCHELPATVRRRLTIENDDRLYSLRDCLDIHRHTGLPVLFDSFHHACLNHGEILRHALTQAMATWTPETGPLMVDYSSQKTGARPGSHAESLDEEDFADFISATSDLDFDLMLEIKDKESSALKALKILQEFGRL